MKIVGKATLAPDISGVGGCGGTCSFFSEEKKEPKKSRLAVLPHMLLSSVVLESYIREVTLHSCAACLAQSQRRLLFPCLRLTLAIICIRFGIPRMDFICSGSFPPRHVRHPSAAQMETRR